MTALRRPLAWCLGIAFLVVLSGTTPGQGKNDKPDIVGVIIQVNRDKDKSDRDLGFIVVDTNKKDRRVVVTKGTQVMKDGKEVGFKALDKGDTVAVFIQGKTNVADKIVIRKND